MSPILSSGLLAATMLLGQTGDPAGSAKAVVPAPPTVQQMQQPTQRPILGWFNRDREDRPLLHRIQGWFKRDQPEVQPKGKIISPSRGEVIRDTDKPTFGNPVPAPTPDFPRKLPNPQGKTQTEPAAPATSPRLQQTSLQLTPKDTKSPIRPQLAGKMGRDEKFEWITGQIEIENGSYVMYYATPETIDKYHGRIVLAPQKVDLSQFRRGDLVSVQGQLGQRPTARGMIPIYQVSFASLIERLK